MENKFIPTYVWHNKKDIGKKHTQGNINQFLQSFSGTRFALWIGVLDSDKYFSRRLEAAGMRFLRSAAGYTLPYRQRNEAIREELRVFPLTDNSRISEEIGITISVAWMLTETL